MNFFKEKYYEKWLSKDVVLKAYENAQIEIENEDFSKGLMARCKSKSQNNTNESEAIYLDLRAEQILKNKIEKKYETNKEWFKRLVEITPKIIKIPIKVLGILILLWLFALVFVLIHPDFSVNF